MLYTPEEQWRDAEPHTASEEVNEEDFVQLLQATLRATSCSAAAIFVEEGGRFIRRTAAGQPLAELLELSGRVTVSDLPSEAFQLSPQPPKDVRLTLTAGGQKLACYALACIFTRKNAADGILIVVDEIGRGISAAQRYMLEAQAAHCGALLELELLRQADRRAANGEQSQRLRLLESVAVHARDSIIITEAEPLDLPGPRILFCNAAFERATGYSAQEVLGKTPRILQGPETSAATRAKLRAAFARWEPVEVELINYRKNGSPFWVELSIVPVADESGWFTHWVSVQRDITERKAAEELAMRMRITQIENELLASEINERKRVEAELVYTAYHDSLTRLRNRAFFMERLSSALERQRLEPRRACAVLFLDLDRFKVINDSLGHIAGDTLLKEVARRLKTCTRPQDTLARIGGDEFAILIDEGTELASAVAVAERIIETMRAPVRLGRQEVFPGCSIGIVQSSTRSDSPEALLRDADIAMYEAKRAGNGDYAVFTQSMHATAVAKLQLQTDLRRAVGRNEFEVVYQPIIALAENSIAGFEALLRWRHPERGLIAPSEFIDAAEEIGLIRQIDRWVREEACAQLKQWQVVFNRPDLCMSVNASASEFADGDIAGELTELCRFLGLQANAVQLEITEGIFLNPAPSVTRTIEQVRQLGVRIALDDFGTGFSSLSYINRYPIDTIKIDKTFVAGMSGTQRTLAVVELIVNLGRTLDVAIVAEGIEAEEEAAILTTMGCAYGQGFRFSAPVTADYAASLLRWDDTHRRTPAEPHRLAG